MREVMKLQYQILTSKTYSQLALFYSNEVKYLKQVMMFLRIDDNSIQYEAILQLSIFLLMPQRDAKIISIFLRNKQLLMGFIEQFTLTKEDEDYSTLREIMLTKLEKLSAEDALDQPGATDNSKRGSSRKHSPRGSQRGSHRGSRRDSAREETKSAAAGGEPTPQ